MAKESIESLLNPSLRVSRPIAACARCRLAKIKCDGKLPACSACEKAGKEKECSSANDEFARGKERSYVAAVETAIQRLQRRINELKGIDPTSRRGSAMDIGNDRPPFHRKPVSNSSRKEAYDLDELVSDFGFLTVNATSRDFHGFASAMSFSRLLMATSLLQDLPNLPESPLPSRYAITNLINNYFENIYVTLPFFSETEFMSSVSRIYQEPMSFSSATALDLWNLRLVLAISSATNCRMQGDAAYDQALQHFTAAMKYADYVLHPGSVSGIQALLLLVQYALLSPEYLNAWYLIGMASRLVVDLGLHCEPSEEIKISRHSLDLRRRVFYCVFALDRLVSMSLGYAFSFTDDSAPNVLLPTLAIDQENRSPSQMFLRSIRPSLFLFDVRRVQSAFYQNTRCSSRSKWSQTIASDYINSTLNDLDAWYSSIFTTLSAQCLRAFRIEYLYSRVLALSPNQVIPSSLLSALDKIRLFQAAISYATEMQIAVQDADQGPFLNYIEFRRAQYVGRQFQSLMRTDFDLTLTQQLPSSPPVDSLRSSHLQNCNAAIGFISDMGRILDYSQQRWAISDLKDTFVQESAVLLARLKSKQQELNNAFPLNNNSLHVQQSQQPVSLPTIMQPTENTYFMDSQSYFPAAEAGYIGGEVGSAMHHANIARTTSWSEHGQPTMGMLPTSSQPRRSYEFTGGGNQ